MVVRVGDNNISHYNPNSWKGRGTSVVLAPGQRANSLSIGGRPLTLHGGLDNGRQVWTNYNTPGLSGDVTINGKTYNFSGGSSSSSSSRVSGRGAYDRSAAEAALGLGMGMPKAYTVTPGQEKALRNISDDLFNRFSENYDPAIQASLEDAGRSRLPYLMAPGIGDLQQKAYASGIGASLGGPSGQGVSQMREASGLLGQGMSGVSADALSADELGMIGADLGNLKFGLGLNKQSNQAAAGLARAANSGLQALGDAELQAQLSKMGHDAQMDISSIQTQMGLAKDAASDKLGYWDMVRPFVDVGIDELIERIG